MSLSTYEVWIPPIWLSLVSVVISRLLRMKILSVMLAHANKVNRIVDCIMSHQDNTLTLTSFLRSPDVVGIIKDYCGNRNNDNFLYIYARLSTIHGKTSSRIHPDVENGIEEVPRYYQEPTEIEDVTRQVIEADGVLIFLKVALSLVTVVIIMFHLYTDTLTYTSIDTMIRAVMRVFNSGIMISLMSFSRMVLTVRGFRYSNLRCTPVLVLINIVYIPLAISMCICLIIYLPYTAIHILLIMPVMLIAEYLETRPYLGVKLFSMNDKHYHGYNAYAQVLVMAPTMRTIPATSITVTLLWVTGSSPGWWDCTSYDFYRRLGFIVPTDAVSIFQFLTLVV